MKATIALLIALLASTVVLGQERPTIAAQPNSVFVGADGKFEANPDTALMQFNISAQEATSRQPMTAPRRRRSRYGRFCGPTGLSPRRRRSATFPCNPFMTTKRRSGSWWDIR
jgi:uncharacterized protein YggE